MKIGSRNIKYLQNFVLKAKFAKIGYHGHSRYCVLTRIWVQYAERRTERSDPCACNWWEHGLSNCHLLAYSSRTHLSASLGTQSKSRRTVARNVGASVTKDTMNVKKDTMHVADCHWMLIEYKIDSDRWFESLGYVFNQLPRACSLDFWNQQSTNDTHS